MTFFWCIVSFLIHCHFFEALEDFQYFCVIKVAFSNFLFSSSISSPCNGIIRGNWNRLWHYYPPIWFPFIYHRNNKILGNFFLSLARRAETERKLFLEKPLCQVVKIFDVGKIYIGIWKNGRMIVFLPAWCNAAHCF